MSDIQQFRSVKSESHGRFQSRGSKFYAYLFPIEQLSELEDRIHELKREYIKARHFCYAYRLLDNDEVQEYYSDAGEPGGSSGPPILAVLKQKELLNIACVVVRIFGGTKLGIPGLIEAYGQATLQSADDALFITYQRVQNVRLNMPMKFQPHLLNAIKREGIEATDPEYTSRYEVTLSVPATRANGHISNILLQISDRDYDDLSDQLEYLDITLEELGEGLSERP